MITFYPGASGVVALLYVFASLVTQENIRIRLYIMSLKEQTPIKIQATQSLLHLHCICGWSLALKMAEVSMNWCPVLHIFNGLILRL